jgi:hypothetical protein
VAVSLSRAAAHAAVALLGGLLQLVSLLLAQSGRLLLRLAAQGRRTLPKVLGAARRALAAMLRLLTRLGRAARSWAHMLGARVGSALAEHRARKVD